MVEASRGEGSSLFPRKQKAWKCVQLPAMCTQKLVTERPSDWSLMKSGLDYLFSTIDLLSLGLTKTLLHIFVSQKLPPSPNPQPSSF